MLLIDAIREKDYVEKLIERHEEYLMSVIEFDIGFYDEERASLDNLYSQCQQLKVSIERAKHNTIIQLNDAKLSLSDAIIIKRNIQRKHKYYEILLINLIKKGKGSDTEIYIKDLNEFVDQLSLDVKTLDDEINYAMQNVEVSS